jgi:peptidoglycan hydrolase-like protein with peptidoglycan-binding domain
MRIKPIITTKVNIIFFIIVSEQQIKYTLKPIKQTAWNIDIVGINLICRDKMGRSYSIVVLYYRYMTKYNFLSMRALLQLIAVTSLLVFGVMMTSETQAATVCTFDRDLQMGIIGEDVKCLQKYLNANGFVITTTGGGSPGKETDEFKTLTEAALVKWQQANKLVPASGYFGPRSQQMYKTLVSGVSVTKPISSTTLASGVDTSQDALLKKVDELKAQLSGSVVTPKPVTKTTTVATSVAKQLKEVTSALRDAEEEVSDNDNADDYTDALDSLADARDEFYAAVLAYIAGDTADAEDALDSVEDSIDDALDSVGASSEAKEAEDLIDEVDDAINEAEDEVDQADEDGKATSDAEDILDEAKDVLDEAKVALDDEDYDEALDLAEEAEELVDDAIDAIGKKKGNDIEDELDDARDELDDARDELDDAREDVDAAEDDGDDMDDAQDYLDEAEYLLDDAEDAIDDGDDDEAEDLIDEALDLINDAIDEL